MLDFIRFFAHGSLEHERIRLNSMLEIKRDRETYKRKRERETAEEEWGHELERRESVFYVTIETKARSACTWNSECISTWYTYVCIYLTKVSLSPSHFSSSLPLDTLNCVQYAIRLRNMQEVRGQSEVSLRTCTLCVLLV